MYLLGVTDNDQWQGVIDASDEDMPLPPSTQFFDLRTLLTTGTLPPAQLSLAGYATSLVAWHQVSCWFSCSWPM